TVLPFLETPMMVVPCQTGPTRPLEVSSMAGDMGRSAEPFNPRPGSGWTESAAARVAGSAAAAQSRGADLADVAEQVLQERPLATERRRLVAVRLDPDDLLHARGFRRGDVAGGIERDREHGVPVDVG